MRRARLMYGWVCLLCLLHFYVGCNVIEVQTRQAYRDPLRFEHAIAQFEKQDQKSPAPARAVVCVGSSSIRFWHERISADLAPLAVIPRGFGGSNMNDLLHYADRVILACEPRAVLIYEGDNDIAQGVSPEAIAVTFEKLVGVIHASLPDCRVYLLSIKPSPARWGKWPKMKQANELLAKACGGNDLLTYIDIASPMLGEDGEPDPSLFVNDRLHMTRKGYEVWRDAIRPVLVEAERHCEASDQ